MLTYTDDLFFIYLQINMYSAPRDMRGYNHISICHISVCS